MSRKTLDTIKVKMGVDEQEVELAFVQPSTQDLDDAGAAYSKEFNKALKNGAILVEALDKYMKEQGLWDENDTKTYHEKLKEISDIEVKLTKKGGIKLSEARELAIRARELRFELQQMTMRQQQYLPRTAEGQAESHRFNFLFTRCLVYNKGEKAGKPVFKNIDAYLDADIETWMIDAAKRFAELQNNLNEDFEKTLFENQFLSKYGFVDEQLRLIDKNGRLIDSEGNLIDEFGNPIDEDGNPLDTPQDDGGDFEPFLDDDGNPILDTDTESES